MQPGIGGADAPAPDIGSLLASGGAQGAAPGAAMDPNAVMQDALLQVRQIGQQVDAFTQQYPAVAQFTSQIATLLKQAVIALAGAQPAATPSGQAVPGAGAASGM